MCAFALEGALSTLEKVPGTPLVLCGCFCHSKDTGCRNPSAGHSTEIRLAVFGGVDPERDLEARIIATNAMAGTQTHRTAVRTTEKPSVRNREGLMGKPESV